MLKGLRQFCTRQKLFLSYASEDFAVAEEIAQLLTIEGHEVFFDRRSLRVSENYAGRIRDSINRADRFLFLISGSSLAASSYTRTELEFAQSRWPSPAGNVIPILLDHNVTIEQVPVYLRSIHILSPRGNAASEVVAAMQEVAKVKPRCWAILAAAILLVAAALTWAFAGVGSSLAADVVLQPIEKVYFAPLREPPAKQTEPGAPTEWKASPLTVTLMPIAYNHRSEPSRRARVLNEQLDVQLGERSTPYRWRYIVEITNKSCPDWLCVKSNAGPETLEPGRTSVPRETMFLPAREAVTWKDFFAYVLAAPDPRIKVVLRYTLDLPSGSSSHEVTREKECHIDVGEARIAFRDHGYAAGGEFLAPFMQSVCLPSPPPAK